MRPLIYISLTFFVTWALIAFWGPTGLPFWPIMFSAAALLTVWGVGSGAWVAPLAVLAAYVAMRGVFTWVDDGLREHYAFFVWTFAGLAVFFRAKWYIAGAACFGASAVYASSAFLGVEITRLAPNAILAEMFAILALISIGGGLYDRWRHSRSASAFNSGIRDPLAGLSHRVGEDQS